MVNNKYFYDYAYCLNLIIKSTDEANLTSHFCSKVGNRLQSLAISLEDVPDEDLFISIKIVCNRMASIYALSCNTGVISEDDLCYILFFGSILLIILLNLYEEESLESGITFTQEQILYIFDLSPVIESLKVRYNKFNNKERLNYKEKLLKNFRKYEKKSNKLSLGNNKLNYDFVQNILKKYLA